MSFMSTTLERDNAGVLSHSQRSAHLDLGMLQQRFLCQQTLSVGQSILACVALVTLT